MSTFQRCNESVNDMAAGLMMEHANHRPLVNNKVKIDYVFALASLDEKGERVGHAIMHKGIRALGVARKIPLKDRALGRADAEIMLDGDWWADASPAEQLAVLDHELTHLEVKTDKRGVKRDDLGRPVLVLRLHDYEFGFFNCIAERHGAESQERKQAARMMADGSQYYWPDLVKV